MVWLLILARALSPSSLLLSRALILPSPLPPSTSASIPPAPRSCRILLFVTKTCKSAAIGETNGSQWQVSQDAAKTLTTKVVNGPGTTAFGRPSLLVCWVFQPPHPHPPNMDVCAGMWWCRGPAPRAGERYACDMRGCMRVCCPQGPYWGLRGGRGSAVGRDVRRRRRLRGPQVGYMFR